VSGSFHGFISAGGGAAGLRGLGWAIILRSIIVKYFTKCEYLF